MDNVREKLVELIRVRYRESSANDPIDYRIPKEIAEKIADHLLANGVTVQEWIPVTERYPNKEDANEFDEVLTFLRNGKRTTGNGVFVIVGLSGSIQYSEDGGNTWTLANSPTTYPYYMVNSKSSSFLYWMPLSALQSGWNSRVKESERVDTDKVMDKINSMSPDELSKLLCEALDESGIKYEIGKCNINFNDLSIDDRQKGE